MYSWLFLRAAMALICSFVVMILLFRAARKTGCRALWWAFVGFGGLPFCAAGIGPLWDLFGIGVALGSSGPMSQRSMEAMWLLLPMVGAGGQLAVQVAALVKLSPELAATSRRPLCPACAYNLTGLTGDRCPECGTRFLCETRYVTRRM